MEDPQGRSGVPVKSEKARRELPLLVIVLGSHDLPELPSGSSLGCLELQGGCGGLNEGWGSWGAR
jgi:hypothetical protein